MLLDWRTCSVCKETLGYDSFPLDSSRKHGIAYECKLCKSKRSKTYRENNKEPISKSLKKWYMNNKAKSAEKSRKWHKKNHTKKRDKHLRKSYGISLVEYANMVLEQDGLCLICKLPPTGSGRYSRLFVDHCHYSGRIRGLLCSGCNTALGMVKEREDTLLSMIEYIKINKVTNENS